MKCVECSKEFEGKATKKFCSGGCKTKYGRTLNKSVSVAQAGDTGVSVTGLSVSISMPVTESPVSVTDLYPGIIADTTDPQWRIDLINEIKAGLAEGKLSIDPKYGVIIDRTPAQAREYDHLKDMAKQHIFHTSKERDKPHWENIGKEYKA